MALLFIVAFFIGMAKTGVHGASMFAVPVLAIIFGGKASAGIVIVKRIDERYYRWLVIVMTGLAAVLMLF